MTTAGEPFYHPVGKPVNPFTKCMPSASYIFTVSGSGGSVQALVYQDAFLKFPYQGNPQADTAGNFKPIFLDPRVQYRVQLVDQAGNVQYTVDPYIPPLPSTGTGPIQINPMTGEVQINAPGPTGTSAALTVTRVGGAGAGAAIICEGNASRTEPLLHFLNALTTGSQTANFAAVTNKPGGAFPTVAFWLPILGDGGITYYIPLWG